jgi:phosphatidate cytidylyltransferase
LGSNAFTGLECKPNPVFLKHEYDLPFFLQPVLSKTLWVQPMQFHILAMATFASLIAPFGGFFASGLKRTFKIKDFGDLVPGHGGITGKFLFRVRVFA